MDNSVKRGDEEGGGGGEETREGSCGEEGVVWRTVLMVIA